MPHRPDQTSLYVARSAHVIRKLDDVEYGGFDGGTVKTLNRIDVKALSDVIRNVVADRDVTGIAVPRTLSARTQQVFP